MLFGAAVLAVLAAGTLGYLFGRDAQDVELVRAQQERRRCFAAYIAAEERASMAEAAAAYWKAEANA